MKKLWMSVMLVGLISFAYVDVNAKSTSFGVETKKDQGKEPVKPEDLPEPVKKTLATEPYSEWEVVSAFSVITEQGKQFYEINLKRGESDVTVVKLDKEGNPVE